MFPPPHGLCFHHHVEQLVFICLLSDLRAVTIPFIPSQQYVEGTQQVIVEGRKEGREGGREGGRERARKGGREGRREGRSHYLLIMSL